MVCAKTLNGFKFPRMLYNKGGTHLEAQISN